MGRNRSNTRRPANRQLNLKKLEDELHTVAAKNTKPIVATEMSKRCKHCKLAEWDHPIGGCNGFEALTLAEFAQLQAAEKALAERIRRDYEPITKAQPHDIELANWIEDLCAG